LDARWRPAGEGCQHAAVGGYFLCRPAPPAAAPRPDPAAAARARQLLLGGGILLVPDSEFDRVMAFDPQSGALVNPNYIPSDPTHLLTPKNAIRGSGGTILVADQAADVVQEYSLTGNYLGVFAPAGGPNPAILDNIRGIALRPNGNLLVTVAAGGNEDAVAEFDPDGAYLGNFVPAGSGGLDSPFDAFLRPADWLVSGMASQAVHRFDLAGAYIGDFAAIDSFPEQIATTPAGNVLVANFIGALEGILEYEADGTFVDRYHPLEAYRGVAELGNGNLLVSSSAGVFEIDRLGNVIATEYSGEGAQYIELLSLSGPTFAGSKTAAADWGCPEGGSCPLTYTIGVNNVGLGSSATLISDTLPAGMAYLPDSLTCEGGAGACAYDSAAGRIEWNGAIGAFETVTLTFAVTTDGLVCGQPVENVAAVSDPAATEIALLAHSVTPWENSAAYDFENDDGGFMANTPPGEWEWGDLVPSDDSPPSAHSGVKLWATNLAGDISIEPSQHFLTMTAALGPALPARLSWWEWWDEDGGADSGQVLVNGSAAYTITTDALEWRQHVLGLPGDDQTVEVVWFYDAEGIDEGPAGWYLDDVLLYGCQPPDFSQSVKEAPPAVTSGESFSYSLTLTNPAAWAFAGVSLTDPIPAGAEFVPGSASGGASYNAALNQVEWQGTLPAGGSLVLGFQVTAVVEQGVITNTAAIGHTSGVVHQLSATTAVLPDQGETFGLYLPVILSD
ncbi:MAG: hypothetical protein ACRDHL_03055, partial [Candidatus Promineifilaceae bacterium]